jgi:hypothetical protein
MAQMAMNHGKRAPNDPITGVISEVFHNNSNQDIFSSANSEQAKYMIMNGVRRKSNRSNSRAISESSSDDYPINKIDPVDVTVKPTVVKIDKNTRKPTMLLAGPKFRYHTTELEYDLKRDTIYPISV